MPKIKPSIANNYPTSLESFLLKHKVNKGDEHTHTSMGKPVMASFNIPETKLEDFYQFYEKDRGQTCPLSITEKHREVAPILIDIDLRYDGTEETRHYTPEHVERVVKAYIDEIQRVFDLEGNEISDKVMAFVFEKNKPYTFGGEIRDGFHVMFPYIISNPSVQYLIHDNIIKNGSQLFEGIPLKKTDLGEIIDRSVIEKNGWFLYGSHKPNKEAYKNSKIYNHRMDIITFDDVEFQGIPYMSKFFSIRRYHKTDSTPILPEIITEVDKIIKKSKGHTHKQLKKIGPSNSNYDIKTVTRLVETLNNTRADNYQQWMEVGWCLHNIDHTNVELLGLWIEFSKCSTKFKEGACELEWKNFRTEGFALGSLHYWAKMDDPEAYLDIRRDDIQFYILKSINCTNVDVARVMYAMFRGQYVCCSYKSNIWFEYKNHRWQEIDAGVELRKKISTDLEHEYSRLIDKYNENAVKNTTQDSDDNTWEEKADLLYKIIIKIKTTKFKDDVMKECKELFHKHDFLNKLDSNPYLIGFENGIFDLVNHEFRDGRPENYLTFSTGNNYVEFDEDDPLMQQVEMFMSQVFIKDHIRRYMYMVLASCLQGVNAEEKFRVLIGVGANGKSKLNELFQLAFGDYCHKFPVTLLTQKRGKSNAVSPEVIKGKGKRYTYFEEPDEGERINVGLMKEYSGNDKITGRGLYKDPVTFKPQWKIFVISNTLLEMPPHDKGTWRRVEGIEFESEFVDAPKKANEFYRDNYLSEKLEMWKEAFMYTLLCYYKEYRRLGIVVPREVLAFTEEYKKDNDCFSEFSDNYFTKTENTADRVLLDDAYDEFKFWFSSNMSSSRVTSAKDFKKYLSKVLGKIYVKKNHVEGFIFNRNGKRPSDDPSDSDADTPPEDTARSTSPSSSPSSIPSSPFSPSSIPSSSSSSPFSPSSLPNTASLFGE